MRLKAVRKSRKLTQQQVANLLGVPLRTYQNYEREVNEPDTHILCSLADYYGVTTDYLIGRSDIAVAQQVSVLNHDEDRLVTIYRSLVNRDRHIVMTLAERLMGDLLAGDDS